MPKLFLVCLAIQHQHYPHLSQRHGYTKKIMSKEIPEIMVKPLETSQLNQGGSEARRLTCIESGYSSKAVANASAAAKRTL